MGGDAELKLYYNRARYYSPDLGRFISRDPIDVGDDINLYAYVGNNGVGFVDRMGLRKNSLITIGEIIQDIAVKAILDGIWIGGALTDLPNKIQLIKVIETPSFKVSSYMLRNFMYGDGSSEYYGNDHWISEKLAKTNFYKNEISDAKSKILNNIDKYKIENYKTSGKGDLTSGLSTDFPTSFGTVNWTITAKINQEGQIETNFNIEDTYIYNYHYADGSLITEWPNVYAKYYQDRGYGTPFKWELNITETFNY